MRSPWVDLLCLHGYITDPALLRRWGTPPAQPDSEASRRKCEAQKLASLRRPLPWLRRERGLGLGGNLACKTPGERALNLGRQPRHHLHQRRAGRGPVEPRTTRSADRTRLRGGTSESFNSSISMVMASRPIAFLGWATVVSGGEV